MKIDISAVPLHVKIYDAIRMDFTSEQRAWRLVFRWHPIKAILLEGDAPTLEEVRMHAPANSPDWLTDALMIAASIATRVKDVNLPDPIDKGCERQAVPEFEDALLDAARDCWWSCEEHEPSLADEAMLVKAMRAAIALHQARGGTKHV